MKNKNPIVLWLAALTCLGFVFFVTYALIENYFLDQAERRSRCALLECRSFHHYVQKDLLPTYFRLRSEGALPDGFYEPSMLSSSYMVRHYQHYYNEERQKLGLPKIIYKIAALNPRNPNNAASPREAQLIAWFNASRNRTSYREIIRENDQSYMLYAQPFLPINKGCLACHGSIRDVPTSIRSRYPKTGGLDLKENTITAIEFIKTPLDGEFDMAVLLLCIFIGFSGIWLWVMFRNASLNTLNKTKSAALQKSLSKARAILDASPASIVLLDRNGRIKDCNKLFCFDIGRPYEEVLGHAIADLDCDIPKNLSREELISHFQQAVDSGETVHTIARYNNKVSHITLYPVKSPDGTIEQVVIEELNITENFKLRLELQKLRDQYRHAQKMEGFGRLAGGVAHDFNNLLSPILGYCELLLEQLSPENTHRPLIEEINSAGIRGRDLVRQLLAFSRKQTLQLRPIDLNTVITDFQKLLRRTVRENIEFQTWLAPGIPPILADVGQIEQVIMNLVVNARDAMPEGGRLLIETSVVDLSPEHFPTDQAAVSGCCVMLSLRDTGCGMDDATQHRIFEPFFTTKPTAQGTGLGLATVYGIVRQHGGTIAVDSAPDQGTTFQVYFPSTEAAVPVEATPQKTLRTSNNETIMVVEDDASVRNLTRTILRRNGYTVLTADSGAGCLRMLDDHGVLPDLLLFDVILTDMNGKALFEKVTLKHPGLKVLYMSGYTDAIIDRQGILDEGIGFIHKPFSSQELAAKVREVMNKP